MDRTYRSNVGKSRDCLNITFKVSKIYIIESEEWGTYFTYSS